MLRGRDYWAFRGIRCLLDYCIFRLLSIRRPVVRSVGDGGTRVLYVVSTTSYLSKSWTVFAFLPRVLV